MAALAAASALFAFPHAVRAKDLYSFLGAVTLPNNATFDKTVIGGLSGIAYEPASKKWLLISDDKSAYGPARFYTAQVELPDGFLSTVRFTDMTPLTDPKAAGAADPVVTKTPYSDPEAIAVSGNHILWTSEDSWKARAQNTLKEATLEGVTTRDYDIPDDLKIDFDKKIGPRDNNGFESLAVDGSGAKIWVGVESPLVQDAPLPDEKNGAPVRLTEIDRKSGKVDKQFVYPLEHRAAAALAGKHADGPGLTELADVDSTHLLAMERSWVEGVTNFVQIYLVDTAGASDVQSMSSLKGQHYTPVRKKLLIDLNKVGIQMDNYEGMALGPVLADGRRLLLVSVDNNFNPLEKTIVAAFAVDLKAALSGE